LIERCLEEQASKAEVAQLEELLRDSEFRKEYLSYLNVDMSLAALPEEVSLPKVDPAPSSRIVKFAQWRPLASSAAIGLFVGLLGATVAWSMVGTKTEREAQPSVARVIVPIINEGFENTDTPMKRGFPNLAGVWGGDVMEVVTATPINQALEGKSVLKLHPSPKFKQSHLKQIIDVSSFPQAEEGEIRVIEVIASFLVDQTDEKERYTINLSSFKESPEEIRSLREGISVTEIDELTLTLSKKGVSTSKNTTSWQTFSNMVEVPSTARSVVISLGAGRKYRKSEKTAHYIDDVRAELRILPFSERFSNVNSQ